MEYIENFPPDRAIRQALGEKPAIHPTCRVHKSSFGKYTEVYPHCQFVESEFGDYSYAAGYVDMIYSTVGKFASIASYVRLNPGQHPMHRAAQHHFTYRSTAFGMDESDDLDFFQWRRERRVEISDDVWIGHGALVMGGVKIGRGAVVGSCAVVTKDVEPYSIVAGIPAKKLRMRFDDKTIEKAEKSRWWDWDHETLTQRLQDFRNPALFWEKYGG